MPRIVAGAAVIFVMAAMLASCGDDDAAGRDGAAVTIEILEEEGGGAFTATGDAVDEGLICASGNAQITEIVDGDTGLDPTPSTTALLLDQVFSCDDGSGTFTLQETEDISDPSIFDEAIAAGEPFPTQDWVVSSGTGDYTVLAGSGTYMGQAIEPGSRTIRNTFTGTLTSG